MRPIDTIQARRATAVVALSILAVAAPAAALAQAPGLPGTPESGGAPSAKAATPTKGPIAKATKTRSRVSVRSVRRNVTVGGRVVVRGVVTPRGSGRRVRLQVQKRGGWTSVARDRSGRNGAFRLRYTPAAPASLRVRVLFLGDSEHRASRRTIGRVSVFRRALASWYGPGLYGGQMACGGRLSPSTLGVAHKTLPCGTKVTIRNGSRSVRVAVVDRGPYVGAREFDLTNATRQRIGFSGHGVVLSTK